MEKNHGDKKNAKRLIQNTGTSEKTDKSFKNGSFEDRPVLNREPGTNVYLVTYADATWRLDPKIFAPWGGTATPYIDPGETEEEITLELKFAVFPGTNLTFDFFAKICRYGVEWFVDIRVICKRSRSTFRFEVSVPLKLWLSQDYVHGECRVSDVPKDGFEFKLGNRIIRFEEEPAQISLNNKFSLIINTPISSKIRLNNNGDNNVYGQGLTLNPTEGAKTKYSLTGNISVSGFFTFTHFDQNVKLGSIELGLINVSSFEGEGFTNLDPYLRLSQDKIIGAGSLSIYTNSSHKSILHLKKAELSFRKNSIDSCEAELKFFPIIKPQIVEFETCFARVVGNKDISEINIKFRGTNKNWKWDKEEIVFSLLDLFFPIEGCDYSKLSFNDDRTVRIGIPNFSESFLSDEIPPLVSKESPELIFGGNNSSAFSLSLDYTYLYIRRSVDLLNICFSFYNFELMQTRQSPQNSPVFILGRLTEGENWKAAKMAVHFPGQHLAETQYTKFSPPTENYVVSLSRLSGPSQIVFKFDERKEAGGDEHWHEKELTVGNLTNWTNLIMQVTKRAEIKDSIEEQLQGINIDADTDLQSAIENINASFKPPERWDTALEMTGRLLFSPDQKNDNKWVTPGSTMSNDQVVLWNAHLNDRGRGSVRAIWSNWLTPEVPGDYDETDELLALTQKNHWDVVAQTSVHGLPALRRIKQDIARSSGSSDEVESALGKLRPSRVVRPKTVYKYLDEIEELPDIGINPGDAGIVIPSAFDDANIVLTSVGGSFIAEWSGEPPNLLGLDYGVSLEKLGYESYLGRDIKVEAVDKGYLFPLGLRASFVTLTERKFLRHPIYHYPVAYPIKRQFIVISNPYKNFKSAVHVPFDSRDFPPENAQMLTKVTPDLREPVSYEDGGLLGFEDQFNTAESDTKKDSSSLIFWPRVLVGEPGTPGDVSFEWLVDSSKTKLVCNLLFIGNAALAVPGLMKLVMEYYRALGESSPDPSEWSSLRRVGLGGARCKYTPTEKEGQTSFDTSSWLLSARGRLLGNDVNSEHFRMDGLMEGADQPPFYPFVEGASVSVQTLNRLLGKPQSFVTISYNTIYRNFGYHDEENKAEIFADIKGPGDIYLDVSSQGDSVGGLAQPSSLAAALSRKTGIVGGSVIKNVDKVTLRSEKPRYDISSALGGNFNPDEFLDISTLEKFPKLLGVVKLSDVLEVELGIEKAPTLLEELGYGVLLDTVTGPVGDVDRETVKFIKKLVDDGLFSNAIDFLEDLLIQTDEVIKDAGLGSDLVFKDFYPGLHQQIEATIKIFRNAQSDVKNPENDTLVKLSPFLGAAVKSSEALLSELHKTVKNPLPPQIHEFVSTLGEKWSLIKSIVTGEYQEFSNALLLYVSSAFEPICRSICEKNLSSVFFPRLSGSCIDDCQTIISSPELYVKDVSDTLFYQNFGEPISNLLLTGQALKTEITNKIEWLQKTLMSSLSEVTEALEGFVEKGVESIKYSLSDTPPQDSNIRYVEAQKIFVLNTIEEINDNLKNWIGINPSNDIEEIEAAIDRIRKGLQTLPQILSKVVNDNSGLFKLKDPSDDIEEVIEAFKKEVLESFKTELEEVIENELIELRIKINLAHADVLNYIAILIKDLIKTTSQSLLITEVSRLGRLINGWCDQIVVVATKLASDLVGETTILEKYLTELNAAIENIEPPGSANSDQKELVEFRKNVLIEDLESLREIVKSMDEKREELKTYLNKPPPTDCSSEHLFLVPVNQLIHLRRDAVVGVRCLTHNTGLLKSDLIEIGLKISTTDTDEPGKSRSSTRPLLKNNESELEKIVKALGGLLNSVTSIAAVVGNTDVWSELTGVIDDLLNNPDLSNLPGNDKDSSYVEELEAITIAIKLEAKDLNKQIEEAVSEKDFDKLETIGDLVVDYSINSDRAITAKMMQTVVFAEDLYASTSNNVRDILKNISNPLIDLHTNIKNPLDNFVDFINENKLLSALVKKGDLLKKLNDGIAGISNDLETLNEISDASSNTEIVNAANELSARWEAHDNRHVITVLSSLAELVEDFLQGELGAIIALPSLQEVIKQTEEYFEEIIRKLIPTRYDLSYEWTTKLNPFPPGSTKPVFKMNPSTEEDLVLTTKVGVDFVNGTQTATVSGRISAFDVMLIPQYPIVTIQFTEATFSSVDGSEPSFGAPIEGVILEENVAFLQTLQSWMSPGDGFFVRPIFSPPGVEAGYTFDAGIIQVGTLSFINVAIGVAAKLFFSGEDARYSFHFAGPDRPFLISSPPYGGGGYLELEANTKEVTKLTMSLGFGAVVAFQFGPLKAHGRIMAGMAIEQSVGNQRITGFFEAVGQGNVGCFGISIAIRIDLTHYADGRVAGTANIHLKFKAGFLSVRFNFSAQYEVKGGSGETELLKSESGVLTRQIKDKRKYIIMVPQKSRKWSEYKRNVAISLLER